jgi:hypothetical protein
MGNNHFRTVNFRQSVKDFPLTVSIDGEVPSWSLSRWNEYGLRFIPSIEENYILRGDRRRLVYKGRRHSHRFTILNDTAFEYDCILEREPDSNLISLLIEGAENFYFYRQPDFISNPFLAGSYAVYKKETLLGEGTGKLCHIHRPEIIDAKGRRCWGELSINGNILYITIPESFLSEAVYPVVVDPTIGTTTVGSQNMIYNEDGDLTTYHIEVSISVNRFLVPETINGTCTGYIYTNDDHPEAAGRPVLYSDNQNIPLNKMSKNEDFIDFRVISNKPKGWRNGTFQTKESITKGSYIWFGVCTEYFLHPRFDYGARLYSDFWDNYDSIPDVYPLYDAQWYYDYKLSMYFTYSTAQNYVCSLIQGVKLTDNRKTNSRYKRTVKQTVDVFTIITRIAGFLRNFFEIVYNNMTLNGLTTFFCFVIENVRAAMELTKSQSLSRFIIEQVKADTFLERIQELFRKMNDNIKGIDAFSSPVFFMRSMFEKVTEYDGISQWNTYIRGIWEEVINITVNSGCGEYYRKQIETVYSKSLILHGLLVFVKIITISLVRDFIIQRILKTNEELVLKSNICREIILDSSI